MIQALRNPRFSGEGILSPLLFCHLYRGESPSSQVLSACPSWSSGFSVQERLPHQLTEAALCQSFLCLHFLALEELSLGAEFPLTRVITAGNVSLMVIFWLSTSWLFLKLHPLPLGPGIGVVFSCLVLG